MKPNRGSSLDNHLNQFLHIYKKLYCFVRLINKNLPSNFETLSFQGCRCRMKICRFLYCSHFFCQRKKVFHLVTSANYSLQVVFIVFLQISRTSKLCCFYLGKQISFQQIQDHVKTTFNNFILRFHEFHLLWSYKHFSEGIDQVSLFEGICGAGYRSLNK